MMGILTNKWSLVILAIIFSYIGGWQTNGWRLEAKQKDALELAIAEHRKQSEKDAEAARKVITERLLALQKTNELLKEARNAKFKTKFNGATFTRLYNKSL